MAAAAVAAVEVAVITVGEGTTGGAEGASEIVTSEITIVTGTAEGETGGDQGGLAHTQSSINKPPKLLKHTRNARSETLRQTRTEIVTYFSAAGTGTAAEDAVARRILSDGT